MEEQPGERGDEGETAAMEGRQAGATPLESRASTRMRRIHVRRERGGRDDKKKELLDKKKELCRGTEEG